MRRRGFLKLSGLGLAATTAGVALDTLAAGLTSPAPAEAARSKGSVVVGGTTLRPPAVPLIVRDPYVSAWLCGTNLVGEWASGWDGAPMELCGLVRIDGRSFVWCGNPALEGVASMTQTSLEVTPTRTIFTLEANGVSLVTEWLSPIEPGNPKLQSVPLGLVSVVAEVTDGKQHAVELYLDISGQWTSWEPDESIAWHTSASRSRHWTIELSHPKVLSEDNQMATFGSAVFSTPQSPNVTYQAGASGVARGAFSQAGSLGNSVEGETGKIGNGGPVFALSYDLGIVETGRQGTAWFSLGHFGTEYGIEYFGTVLPPLWQSFWPSWQVMVDDFLDSASAARGRAVSLDSLLVKAATSAGGAGYAALCALSLRQAYGACQLVRGPGGRPWAFLKELSSGGRISTVDILLDTCPVWLYLDPGYLEMLLEPVLAYASSKHWKKEFAPHCLGFWPVADGNPAGPGTESMPIQVSAGLLIMLAAWAKRVPTETARAFLKPYSGLIGKWAQLLERQLPVPPRQLTTLDYLGKMTGNTNLGALGLVGIGAASQLFAVLGQTSTASEWSIRASALASEWAKKAMDPSGRHLEGKMGAHGTWSNLCNAYWDSALSTGLISPSLASTQASFYESMLAKFGLGYGSMRKTLGRVDQELWTAAWLRNTSFGPSLLRAVVAFVGSTSCHVPFPDTYDVSTGNYLPEGKWRGRSVVGGVFALLNLAAQSPRDRTRHGR